MGSLKLPTGDLVYVDAQIVIYTIDLHPTYAPICAELWEGVKIGAVTAVSSELVLLETLVGPLRSGDADLAADRQAIWRQANTSLLPISREVLLEAARLRAIIPALKTPDAIHAATAILHGCALFISNDMGFRNVPSLPLVLLDDLLAIPDTRAD